MKRGDVRFETSPFRSRGEAEDSAAFKSMNAALKNGLPKGIRLASAQIAAPVVSPFTWSAQFAGGQLVLPGHVPGGDSVRAELHRRSQSGVARHQRGRPHGAGGRRAARVGPMRLRRS